MNISHPHPRRTRKAASPNSGASTIDKGGRWMRCHKIEREAVRLSPVSPCCLIKPKSNVNHVNNAVQPETRMLAKLRVQDSKHGVKHRNDLMFSVNMKNQHLTKEPTRCYGCSTPSACDPGPRGAIRAGALTLTSPGPRTALRIDCQVLSRPRDEPIAATPRRAVRLATGDCGAVRGQKKRGKKVKAGPSLRLG